jgi:hypothetical protein
MKRGEEREPGGGVRGSKTLGWGAERGKGRSRERESERGRERTEGGKAAWKAIPLLAPAGRPALQRFVVHCGIDKAVARARIALRT